MTDHELRAMIREAIARHLGPSASAVPSGALMSGDPGSPHAAHASHVRVALLRGGDDDGACLIEPAVRCSHCGFCLSYGH
jgi:hypothetical protein